MGASSQNPRIAGSKTSGIGHSVGIVAVGASAVIVEDPFQEIAVYVTVSKDWSTKPSQIRQWT